MAQMTVAMAPLTTPPSTAPPAFSSDAQDVRVVVPPINFSLVAPGIYRSGHPNKKNLSFLRRLRLKSVMYLEGTDEYRKDSRDFVLGEGIELFRFDLAREAVRFATPSASSQAALALPPRGMIAAGD